MNGLARSTKKMNKILQRCNVDKNVNAIANVQRAVSEYQQVLLLSIETIESFSSDHSADHVRSKCGRCDCRAHGEQRDEMLTKIYHQFYSIITEMGYASGAFENAPCRRVIDDECFTNTVNCSCEERRMKFTCKQSVGLH